MSSASTIPPHFPLGTQPGQMHPSSQPAMDPARNDYAPRSYPWPSAIEPIAYSQAQAMLAVTYANHAAASQAHAQALPLAVQNDAAALEMAHQQYQSQLRAHVNAYGLAPTTIMDDQLAAFYEQRPPVATIALHPYADANPNQFQPPNARAPSSITENVLAPHVTTSPLAQVQPTRASLHFSNLDAWMDVEYFNKVAGMMNWQNVILKVPHVPSNERVGSSGINGSLVPNNPGYCFMTFPTPASATAVLNALTEGDKPKLMPNSKRPFVVTWATVPASSARTNGQRADSLGHDVHAASLFAPGGLTLLNPHAVPAIDEPTLQSSTRQQEFSIFVGDLAPETTNSDLIAVFRDPILGLRHDREPKFVAPFLSCKSAKIMVDPVLGVSKGYGFVRFGTMADASRALIEMQGLYCLSRPMRISQATAKARTQGFLPQGSAHAQTHGTPPQPFTPPFDYDVHSTGSDRGTSSTVTSPSVLHPVNNAAHAFMVGHRENTSPTGSSSSGRSPQDAQRTASHHGAGGPESDPLDSLPSDTLDALSSLNIDRNTLSQLLKMAMVKPASDQEGGDHIRSASDPLSAPAAVRHFGQSDGMTYRASMAGSGQGHALSQPYSQSMNGTSARSVAPPRNVGLQSSPVDAAQASQAKALIASMIGNNANTLNSSDPYNTTVFVGGLSGLISEDTLRTFFGPFGDIHYVKIPPGKGCGFVQFVRKADAEAAISKMQGFPIGGGRVRLSWGRSQYKAAQAAAQAVNFGGSINETGNIQGVSETQATHILQALGVNNTGNAFPDQRLPSDFQTSRGFGQEVPYGVESTGTLDQYDIRAAPGPHSAMQGENDLANVNLSRSHTFPMFTPFGGELNTFSPGNVSASRSVGGMTVKPHAYGTGPTAPYGGSMALRGSISQRDLEGMENGYAVDSYSDRVHGSYPIRGSGTFQPNDLIRQERAGSGSTIATTASDKTPPPQPMKNDTFDLTGNFAALNFGQNSSFDVYPPHMAEANGMLSPTFGAYMSNKSPKRQYF